MQVIRQARKVTDQDNEALVLVDMRGRPREVAQANINPLNIGNYYVVRRRFVPSELVHAAATTVTRADGGTVEFIPTVEISAVASTTKVVSIFEPRFRNQEAFLLEELNKIIREFVRDRPDSLKDYYEPDATADWDPLLSARIRERLGLEAQVRLLFGKKEEEWLNKLLTESAQWGGFGL